MSLRVDRVSTSPQPVFLSQLFKSLESGKTLSPLLLLHKPLHVVDRDLALFDGDCQYFGLAQSGVSVNNLSAPSQPNRLDRRTNGLIGFMSEREDSRNDRPVNDGST